MNASDDRQSRINWQEFTSRERLARQLASVVADHLREASAERGIATIALSGGSTPDLFFAELSAQELDWPNVIVTLVDERFVPASSDRSNAAFVTMKLLQRGAASAGFEPLYEPVDSVEEAAKIATGRLKAVPQPFDVVVLGMGTDGHTASFFPRAPELQMLTDPKTETAIYATEAVGSGEPRLTWPIRPLLAARHLLLHIEGVEKKSLLLDALASNAKAYPIRAVFDQAGRSIPTYWAPLHQD